MRSQTLAFQGTSANTSVRAGRAKKVPCIHTSGSQAVSVAAAAAMTALQGAP
jgi:hypothetical protein